MIQLIAQMHYGLDVGDGASATTGSSMAKALQTADLKTESGALGDTVGLGGKCLSSDACLTKMSNKHAGANAVFEVVSPSPASDPAAAGNEDIIQCKTL